VLLAIFGAAIALALPRRPGLQRLVSVVSMTGIVAVAATFIWYTHTNGALRCGSRGGRRRSASRWSSTG
jgi:multicomponent Na+:H+ antiporter subunit D